MPSSSPTDQSHVVRYDAAGGVVVDADLVLVLDRPTREEVRLPKGHVDPGESFEEAAIREVAEESGYSALVVASLGSQLVEFDHDGRHWRRTEHFFLMSRDHTGEPQAPERQFRPMWISWDEAENRLTFEREREWVRRARAKDARVASG